MEEDNLEDIVQGMAEDSSQCQVEDTGEDMLEDNCWFPEQTH